MKSVYAMTSGKTGLVKVGLSADVQQRRLGLKTKQTGRLAIVYSREVDDASAVERAAHLLLADKRAHGEWFSVTPEEAIAAIERAVDDLSFYREHQRENQRNARAKYQKAKETDYVQINVKFKTQSDVEMMQRLKERFPDLTPSGIARIAIKALDGASNTPSRKVAGTMPLRAHVRRCVAPQAMQRARQLGPAHRVAKAGSKGSGARIGAAQSVVQDRQAVMALDALQGGPELRGEPDHGHAA